MTFAVDRPFYPYRETKRAKDSGGQRALRVFVVSDVRVEGHIGEDTAWPPEGELLYAKQRDDLGEVLPQLLSGPKKGLWLTAMLDSSSPRPGTAELWFSKASEQSTFERVEVDYVDNVIPIPIDAIVVLLVGGAGIYFWRRGKASAREAM